MEQVFYLFLVVFFMYAVYRVARLGIVYIAKIFDRLEK